MSNGIGTTAIRARLFKEYLAEVAEEPFEYGKTDCCSFARGMVKRLTGEDPCTYEFSSLREASMILREKGGIVQLVSEILGPPQEPATNSEVGDIVVASLERGRTIGIASFGKAFFKTKNYVRIEPLENCQYYWSVPCLKQ